MGFFGFKGKRNMKKDNIHPDESHIFDLPENKYVTNTLTGKKVYFDHTDEYMEEQMNKLEEEKEKVKRK